MADTATIASLATAGGTLVLAVATFTSTRSANRSARIAERALDLNLRPVLIPAHEWDAAERVTFHDEIVQLRGGFATVEERDGQPLLRRAAPQRRRRDRRVDVVARRGRPERARRSSLDGARLPDLEHASSQQQRSLYVPAGDVGYWQGAIREGDTDRGDAEALRQRDRRPQRASRFPALRRPGRRPRHRHPLHALARRERRLALRHRPALDTRLKPRR